MRMRITTGMAMNTYRYNLQKSTQNRDDSMNKVLSHRKFNSFAEDPTSAIQAWRIRRSFVSTNSYLKNTKDTLSRFKIAHDTMGVVSSTLTDKEGRKADIYAASDPSGAGRNELGKVIDEIAPSVIHSMNGAKYGDDFVFSGDDELNAPFTWNADRTILYYRGVNVSAGGVKSPAEAPDFVPKDANGNPDSTPAALAEAFRDGIPTETEADIEWAAYYKDPKVTAQPTSPAPDWVPKNANGNIIDKNDEGGLAQAYKDSLPAPGTSEYEALSNTEKAWTSFLKDDPAGSPNPADEPAWAKNNLDDFGVPAEARKVLEDPNASAAEKAWAEYYVDQGDLTHLNMMVAEEVPVDLGMGLLRDKDGNFVPGTYYDRTLPGIEMLGFGVDKDGDPKNVCMIMKKLGEIYTRCDDNGYYASDEDREDAMRLLDKLKAGQAAVSGKYTDIHAEASFLEQNIDRLDAQATSLNEDILDLEQVDLADAITQFSWDYYCYSAALKVGTQLLSQSLIDYMS